MRTPSVMIVVGLVVGLVASACNPDPRHRTLQDVARDGRGGWVVVNRTGKPTLSGELIAMDGDALAVLDHEALIVVPRSEIVTAEVWAWPTQEGSVGVWGAAGMLSTLSHGVFLVATAPAWLLTTVVTAVHESRVALYRYPDDGWDRLFIWARFPQGLPAGIGAAQLIHQDRATPAPAAPVTPAPAAPVTPTPAAPATPTPAAPATPAPAAPPPAGPPGAGP